MNTAKPTFNRAYLECLAAQATKYRTTDPARYRRDVGHLRAILRSKPKG